MLSTVSRSAWPHDTAEPACPDPLTVIATNLGEARDAVSAWSTDAVITLGGSRSILPEIALAKRRGGTVITFSGWISLAHNRSQSQPA